MSFGQYPIKTGSGAGGAGTVTSVALSDGSVVPIYTISGSPVTIAGTLTFTLADQAANLVFAGPTNGADDQPTFRTLVAADLPFAIGNLTDVGTDGIVITGGTGSVIGAGTSIAQQVADATHNGYLSQTDWSTFNAKQAALTIGNLTDVGTDGITVTGGTGAVIGSGTSLSQHVADSTHNGYLSQTDWSTFNSKQSALTFSQSLTNTAGTVTLTNDTASPGNSKFYGTDGAGTRGWFSSVSGTVTSVALSVPATSIFGVTGSPITSSGTLGLTTTGTSGGIPYFSSTSQLATSGALTASQLVLGGGAGATPTSLAAGSQYVPLTMGAANPGYTALALDQTVATSGTLPVSRGGTGQASNWTAHGVIVATSTTAQASLATGSSGNVLMSNGSGSDPAMASIQGNSTILKTPTVQTFTTGTSQTYTTPTSPVPLYLHVRMVGGGGGGAGSGSAGGTAAGDGGNTLFGTSLLVANGGVKAVFNGANAAGGTASITSPGIGTALSGGQGGGAGGSAASTTICAGGMGASTPFGGGGAGGTVASGIGAAGKNGTVNSGAGGGGGAASVTNSVAGAGGGAGGYVDAIIPTPTTSYTYSVGTAGTAGGAGTGGTAGGAGAVGYIQVFEYYQ